MLPRFRTMTIFVALSVSVTVFAETNGKGDAQQAASPLAQSPGFYRLRIGDFIVTSISDGTAVFPMEKLLQGIDLDQTKKILHDNYRQLPIEGSSNTFLVDTGSKLILVDAGGGDFFKPYLGRQQKNLAASGVKPTQIAAVLITHVHSDHVCGLTINDKVMFPNADVYISRADFDFLYADPQKNPFPEVTAALAPYKAAGKIKTFEAGTTLFPGITAVSLAGHTPGHTAFMIASGNQKLLLWGDVIHYAMVQFRYPEAFFGYDAAPKEAIKTRKQELADAVQGRYWIGAAHIEFPGFGHVKLEDGHYDWLRSPYSLGYGN